MKRTFQSLLLLSLMLSALVVGPTPAQGGSSSHVLFEHTQQSDFRKYWDPTSVAQPPNGTGNWVAPTNYRDGRAYMRFEVTDKPSDKELWVQQCLWTDRYKVETCSPTATFDSEGVYWVDLGAPGNWWRLNGVWNWTQDYESTRLMIKDPITRTLMIEWPCGTHCYKGADLANHIPIGITAEVVLVGLGDALMPPADWVADCPSNWGAACLGASTGDGSPGGGGTPPPAPVPDPAVTVTAQPRALTVVADIPGAERWQVRYRPVGGARVWGDVTASASATLTDLLPGRAYEIEVRGLVRGVWRPWLFSVGTPLADTDPVPDPDPAPIPDADPGVTVTAQPGALLVVADIPGAERWQVRHQAVGGARVWGDVTASATATLTGLTPGTTYNVEVRGLVNKVWQPWLVAQGTPLAGTG